MFLLRRLGYGGQAGVSSELPPKFTRLRRTADLTEKGKDKKDKILHHGFSQSWVKLIAVNAVRYLQHEFNQTPMMHEKGLLL